MPRRLILRVRQQLDPEVIFAITYTIDVSDLGSPVEIKPPGADATAEVSSLNALLESARA